jgi:4-hydroxy-tetrahydrodipicolinate synthase
MNPSNPFYGVICPILTPIDPQGSVDLPALRQLVDFLVEKGVDSLLPGGTTGEGMLLTVGERKLLLETVVNQARGRIKVLAHTGSITTAETISLSRHARQVGADGISVITPYFYSLDEQALFDHYNSVASAVPDLPVSLYSFPGNAKQDISAALLTRLCAAAPNIVAIKSSNPDLIRFQEYVQAGPAGFNPLCGVDALALPALAVGAKGQVSGNANVFPEVFRRLYDAYAAGDQETCQRQQVLINRIRAVFKDNLVCFKAAMRLRGIPVGPPRLPLRELTAAELAEMQAGLADLDLI